MMAATFLALSSLGLYHPTSAWSPAAPALARLGRALMVAPSPPMSRRQIREKLIRDLERPDALKQPDGLAEEDPAAPLALAACRAGDDRKAKSISALRVGHLTSATSFFVSMVGSSKAQINAIVKNVEDELKDEFGRVANRQGKAMSGWVCLDYDSIIVNVFDEASRDFYGVEKYWGGAQALDLSDVLQPDAPEAAIEAGGAGGSDDWELDDWEIEDWAIDDVDVQEAADDIASDES